MHAAIYVRISRDSTGEALGVARQEEDCRTLATDLGWSVSEVYVDNDISASSGRPRPAYDRLLADIESGTVNAIVAWHPDRLYRRPLDLEHLINICDHHHTALRTVRAGEMDLSTPVGRLVARLVGAVNRHEGEAKSDRWRRSYRQAREQGRHPRFGPRLFGYTADGDVIAAEARLIRWLAAETIAGRALNELVRHLNDRDIRTTRGGQWTRQALRNMLTNPRLTGQSTIAGQVVGPGTWQPILDATTWETLRSVLTNRSARPTIRTSSLLGLVHCGICGARMETGRRAGVRVYRCPYAPGQDGCGRVSIHADKLEEMVESYARTRLSDDRVWRGLAARRSSSQAEAIAAEIDLAQARLDELQQALSATDRPVAQILRAMDAVGDDIASKQAQLATHTPVRLPEPGHWPTDLQHRHALVALVVSRVMVDQAKAGPFSGERVRIERA